MDLFKQLQAWADSQFLDDRRVVKITVDLQMKDGEPAPQVVLTAPSPKEVLIAQVESYLLRTPALADGQALGFLRKLLAIVRSE